MDEDDILSIPLPGPPPPSLSPSASFLSLSPSSTTTPSPASYILHLAALPSSYALAFSAPATHITLLDPTTLRAVSALRGHEGAVTAIERMGEAGLASASEDGTVRLWDARAGKSTGVLKTGATKRRVLLSLAGSCDGSTIAAGTELQGDDASIYIWDTRRPSLPLHAHTSTHSDDITSLAFHPSDPRKLLSASVDGLLSLSDALEGDEDEAVGEVGNWGCSVARAGWGDDGRTVWARSDMETVSLWDAELSLVHDFGDARRPTSASHWSTDYIIDCRFRGPDLLILAGSNEGRIAQISTASRHDWSLERVFDGGHSAIVRCALMDERRNVFITGGEDSQLSVWSHSSSSANATDIHESAAMDVDASPGVRAGEDSPRNAGGHQSRKKTRYEPYPKASPGKP